MNEDVVEIMDDCQQSMSKAVDNLKRELAKIRTGRANLAILDGIRVEYYGTPTPLNQVAALTVADPRLITIKPWDKTLVPLIEKSILTGGTGLTPNNDGELIRLPIPPLTGERRKELVRSVKQCGENGKIAVRNIRRDANDLLKSVDSLPEDDLAKAKKQVQDKTDSWVGTIDQISAEKESEILEV